MRGVYRVSFEGFVRRRKRLQPYVIDVEMANFKALKRWKNLVKNSSAWLLEKYSFIVLGSTRESCAHYKIYRRPDRRDSVLSSRYVCWREKTTIFFVLHLDSLNASRGPGNWVQYIKVKLFWNAIYSSQSCEIISWLAILPLQSVSHYGWNCTLYWEWGSWILGGYEKNSSTRLI